MGIETVVVVEVQVVDGLDLGIGIEFDNTHAAEIGSYIVRPLHQGGAYLSIFGPDAVVVGLTVIPEARALHFTSGRGNGREVGVATTFPVHIFEAHPFLFRNRRAIVIAQDNKTLFGKGIEFKVHSVTPHSLISLSDLAASHLPRKFIVRDKRCSLINNVPVYRVVSSYTNMINLS